ncbi:hypothetical protein [Salinirarus marinus]|uniref:hypothetical protein n=1 Tax=Salinirarus marinus TaxID=3068310 RepID=UPI003C6C0238
MLEEGDVREILSNERVCVATDGLFGGKPHPRVYGTYPRILGTYVREENLLTLEEAVRKMTSLPARAMGLDRKGLVRQAWTPTSSSSTPPPCVAPRRSTTRAGIRRESTTSSSTASSSSATARRRARRRGERFAPASSSGARSHQHIQVRFR